MSKIVYFVGSKFYRSVPNLVLSFMGIIILLTLAGFSSAVYVLAPNQQIVVIDTGKGKNYQGATVVGYPEKVLNLAVARWLMEYLTSSGIKVVMTTEEDNNYLSVMQEARAKVCVRLQVNSTSGEAISGVETFYQEGKEEGKLLAEQIQRELEKIKNIRERTPKAVQIKLMKNIYIPSVIIEFDYLSDSAQREISLQPGYQKQLAKSIAKGISNYLALGARAPQ